MDEDGCSVYDQQANGLRYVRRLSRRDYTKAFEGQEKIFNVKRISEGKVTEVKRATESSYSTVLLVVSLKQLC